MPRPQLLALVATSLVLCASSCSEGEPLAPDGVDVPPGACGHALYVLSTDYQSTSVAIVSYQGEVLAGSLVSSGSETVGLSTPLSGDVTAPTLRTARGQLILLDRSEASILSFVDPVSATVERQISVQTGFRSNPQDVLELGDRAYVSRYQRNPDPGQEPDDEGSDILVLDLDSGSIERRIDLAPAMDGAAPDTLPSPSRMVLAQGRVFVLLAALSQSFAATDDSRVAVIDPGSDAVLGRLILDGSRGCSALALSPGGQRLAVGCSGSFAEINGVIGSVLAESSISILSVEQGELALERRIPASDLGEDAISFSLAFASDSTLLASSFGQLSADGEQARPDRLLSVDVETGEAEELARTEQTPFSFGDIRCEPACGACFAADAERRVVHRFAIDDGGALGARSEIAIDDGIGLPPRYLGAY